MLFQAVSKFQKGDWGDMHDKDKEENDKGKHNGEAICGFYKAGKYDIVVILPKERNRIDIMMKHELSKGSIHTPVLYDGSGQRITK